MFSWIFMMIPWCFCVFSHLLCVLLACSPLRIPSNSTSNTRVLNAPHAARCTSHWVCVQADVLLAWKQRCTPYKLHVFFRTRCFTILKCSLVTHAKFWVFHKWIEHAQKRKKHQQIFTLPAKRRSMLRQSQSLYSNFCRYWCLTTFGHAVKASTRKYRQTIGSWLRSADRFTIFRQERWNRIKQDKRQDIKNRKEKNNKTQNRTLLTGFDEVDYQSISL